MFLLSGPPAAPPSPETLPTPAAASDVLVCVHCGTPVRRSAALWIGESPYCCHGCEGAARLIAGNGLERYYQRRDGWSPQPQKDDSVSAFDDSDWQAAHVRVLDDGRCETTLQVDGIRCAACTWLVEKATGSLDGVEECHVSYGTGEALIRWRPDAVRLSDVARRIGDVGYKARASADRVRRDRELLARLGVAAFCAGNVMTQSIAVYAGWFDGMDTQYTAIFQYASLLLATPAVFYSSVPFWERAWAGLRHGVLGMDVPIALAIGLLYGHGVWMTFIGHDGYLDSLTMLIALLLAGRFVEDAGRSRADEAARSVLAEAPSMARRLRDGFVEEVPTASLVPGDIVVVGTGGAVPADGIVHAGEGAIDTALLTGEAEPRNVISGAEVHAGTLLVSGTLEVQVTRPSSASLLASMARLVEHSRQSRPKAQRWMDRIAPIFTAATLVVATLTFGVWAWLVGPSAALAPTVAVLVTACPCALALATPTALAVAMGAAARRGAWVRDADALLRAADVTRVFVDKTGTLTEGRPRVLEASDRAIELAAAIERGSSHPVARAILDEARARGIALQAATGIVETAGQGIEGWVDGHRVTVARSASGALEVREDGRPAGRIVIRDATRTDSAAAIRALGVPVTMLTGDTGTSAQSMVAGMGAGSLDDVQAALSPEQKAEAIERARSTGEVTLFAGDGLNDAAALQMADVGVAMGTGAAASVMVADIVVLRPSLAPVRDLLRVARATRTALRRNSRISVVYNVSAVTAAAFGLVDPLVAAILMPLSSLMVVVGALSIEWSMRHADDRDSTADLAVSGEPLRVSLRAGGA
jgi:Cu2+-exporting ATPase